MKPSSPKKPTSGPSGSNNLPVSGGGLSNRSGTRAAAHANSVAVIIAATPPGHNVGVNVNPAPAASPRGRRAHGTDTIPMNERAEFNRLTTAQMRSELIRLGKSAAGKKIDLWQRLKLARALKAVAEGNVIAPVVNNPVPDPNANQAPAPIPVANPPVNASNVPAPVPGTGSSNKPPQPAMSVNGSLIGSQQISDAPVTPAGGSTGGSAKPGTPPKRPTRPPRPPRPSRPTKPAGGSTGGIAKPGTPPKKPTRPPRPPRPTKPAGGSTGGGAKPGTPPKRPTRPAGGSTGGSANSGLSPKKPTRPTKKDPLKGGHHPTVSAPPSQRQRFNVANLQPGNFTIPASFTANGSLALPGMITAPVVPSVAPVMPVMPVAPSASGTSTPVEVTTKPEAKNTVKRKPSVILTGIIKKMKRSARKAGGLVILRRDDNAVPDRVLLDWRATDGKVAIPGGLTVPGERPLETAIRETYEETGLGEDGLYVWDDIPPHIGNFVGNFGEIDYYTYIAECVDNSFVPQPSMESTAVAWMPLASVSSIPNLHAGFAAAWPHLLNTVRNLPLMKRPS